MAILGVDAVDGDVGAISTAALVGIDGNEIVVATTLQVLYHAEMTVSVEMHTVKIDRIGVSEIVVENYIFNRKIGYSVVCRTVVNGVLEGHIGHSQPLNTVEEHTVARIAVGLENTGLLRVSKLIHIVASFHPFVCL